VVLCAVSLDGLQIQHASWERQQDQFLCLMAVQQNGLALSHISEENKTSIEINLEAVN
jgi:hypothetical protein